MSDYEETVTKLIRKYGKCVRRYSSKKEPGLYTAVCPGCKKEIEAPGSDLSDIQYCVTKRGSATFFHTKCYTKIWDSKIV